jgi:hypothetical protein
MFLAGQNVKEKLVKEARPKEPPSARDIADFDRLCRLVYSFQEIEGLN